MQLPDLLGRLGTKSAPQKTGVRSSTLPDLLQRPTQRRDPFNEYLDQLEAEQAKPTFFGTAKNILGNIANIYGIGDPIEVDKAKIALAQANDQEDQAGAALAEQAKNLFQSEYWNRTFANLAETVGGAISDPIGTAKQLGSALLDLPMIALTLPHTAFAKTAGVDLTGESVRAIDPTERAGAVKETVGNILGMVTGAKVSMSLAQNGLKKALTTAGIESLEKATAPQLLKFAASEPVLGQMGRKIVDDVAGAAIGGTVQGAVSSLGQDDMITNTLLSGVAFAPLGVATGTVRGLWARSRGALDLIESTRLEAAYKATAAQENGLDVMRARLLQANNEKSISQVLQDVENTATSDAPVQAIVRSGLEDNKVGTLRGISREDASQIGMMPDVTSTLYDRGDGLFDIAFWKGDPFFEDRMVQPFERPEKIIESQRDINTTTSIDGRVKTTTITETKGGKQTPLLRDGYVVTKTKDKQFPVDEAGNRLTPKRKPQEEIERLRKEAEVRREILSESDKYEPLPEGTVWKSEPYIIKGTVRIPKGGMPYVEIQGTFAADGTLIKKGGGSVIDMSGWQVDNQTRPPVALGLTPVESSAARSVFKATGKLPEIGTLKDQAEFGSYNGKDFLVRRLSNGTFNLADPHTGKMLMNVPQESVLVRQAPLMDVGTAEGVWDRAFKEFQQQLTKNPNAPFLENLTQTAVKLGLEKNMKGLEMEVARRYNAVLSEALTPWEKKRYTELQTEVGQILTEQEKTRPKLVLEPEELKDRLVSAANSNGMYIQEVGVGYQVRNVVDDTVLYNGNSMADGIEFINRSAQDVNTPLDVDSKVPPTGIVPPSTINGGGGYSSGDFNRAVQSTRQGLADRVRRRYQIATRRATWYTARGEQFTNFDETLGTQFGKRVYEPLQAAQLRMKGALDAAQRQEEPFFKQVRNTFKTAERQEQLARVVEAIGVDEMTQPNGLVKGKTISPDEVKIAQFAAANNVDMPRVLKYRRQMENIRQQALAMEHERAADQVQAMFDANGMTDIPQEVKLDLARKQTQLVESNPWYQNKFMELEQKFKLNPAERQVFEQLTGIAAGGINEGSIYSVVRYAMALQNPEVFGTSRTQLAQKFGFTPQDMQLVSKIDDFYTRRGPEFGIDAKTGRMINHYMNHVKTEGSVFDAEDLVRFVGASDNPNTLRAVFDMVRTGEVQDYSLDVVNNMNKYLRAGYKAKTVYRVLGNENAGIKAALTEELSKVAGKVSNSEKYVKFLKQYADDYIDGVLGRRAVEDTFAEEGPAIALANGLQISEKELKGSIASDAISLFSHLTSSAIMGGRWGMGLRDAYDAVGKYFVVHGRDRAIDFGKIAINPQNLDELVRTGKISRPSADSYYNPGEDQLVHTPGMEKILDKTQRMNEFMFKMTLQDKVYLRAQAAAYMEANKFGGEVLTDLFNQKINATDAMKKMNLSFFDDRVAQKLDVVYKTHGVTAAADYYARENAKLVLGMYGNMEQPKGWNTMVGRLMGSLGQYPMQTRRFVVNASTRGTPQEVRARLTRWAIYNATTFATGKVLGFDMWRWVQTPATMLFVGGPAVGLMSDVASLGQTLGADESKRKYTLSRMGQYIPQSLENPKSLFVPGSYAWTDIMKGFKLLNEEDYGRGIGQLIGTPASRDNSGLLGGR